MPTPLQTQLQTAFAPGDRDVQLLIEPDPNRASAEIVPLLLFPALDVNLAASAGSVRAVVPKTVNVAAGIVMFSGGSVAQLPKLPSVTNPELKQLFAFNTSGQSISAGFQLEGASGTIRASAECYAAVAYTAYQTRAMQLDYTPLTENLGSGVKVTFGVIAAFYPPRSITIYQVEPFGVNEGNVEVEVYRIVSGAVTNNDGEFEKPPSYPASGAYPEKTFVLDTSQTLETERVHEIGYMDQRGRAWVRTHHVPTKEPYVGDTAYAPTKECKVSTIPPDLFSEDLIAKATNWVKQRGYGCKGSSGA